MIDESHHDASSDSVLESAILAKVFSTTPVGALPQSAGALLRSLRIQTAMSLDDVAGTLKVPVKTLEILENDEIYRQRDLVFIRALAASVCRTLKVDAKPVLALMPQLVLNSEIIKPEASLNVPMGRSVDLGNSFRWVKNPTFILTLIIVIGIVLVANWPIGVDFSGKWSQTKENSPADVVAMGSPAPAVSATLVSQGVVTGANVITSSVLPLPLASGSTSNLMIDGGSAEVQVSLTVSAESWVEITDMTGKSIWKKLLSRGESIQTNVPSLSRLAIGNAAATRLSVNGKEVDLALHTNANVARIDLK